MPNRPNILFILADQLRASSLPIYGEGQIETPHLGRLAGDGVTLTNAIASCPVCTPCRAMMLTGRHPQTTGHVINFVRTRHDEIGLGDVFANAGYRTGWIGKWHLHTGSFPQTTRVMDYVPEGRDRLGFDYWRAYNFHMDYYNGSVNLDGWRSERWDGYETAALNRYAFEFLDDVGDDSFCLFLSPHQPHFTPFEFAPQAYYERLPEELVLPENVPDESRQQALAVYRHYLAMTLALDDMVGELLAYLERSGRADDTLVIFSSDHGSQIGAQGIQPWAKKMPYEESIRVPWIMRWPGVFEGGGTCDALTAPVDLLPSLCGLCDIPIPRTVEGYDLSPVWRGAPDAFEQEAVLTMNFTASFDYLVDGDEWRGVRSKRYAYARWLNGKVELYDLEDDPLEMTNLAGTSAAADLEARLETTLQALMTRRQDSLQPCHTYADWFDAQRRVVHNVYGPLRHPEAQPDWSLLS